MLNLLLRAAEPLIVAVGEARLTPAPPDLDALSRQLGEQLNAVEQRARDGGLEAHRVDSAMRVLRLFVDESLAAAPWAAAVAGADERPRFSDPDFTAAAFFSFLVEQVNAGRRDHELLEFMYVLLVLGLDRCLVTDDANREEIDSLIVGLGQTAERGPSSGEVVLSPHWRSPVDPRERLSRKIPGWVTLMFAGLLTLGAFEGFLYLAAEQSDGLVVEFEYVARQSFE